MAYPPNREHVKSTQTTWFGRHYPAMHITERFKDTKGPVVAWVVGVGGGKTHASAVNSTEHIELALALEKANADYHLHVIDNNPGAIESARAASEQSKVRIDTDDPAAEWTKNEAWMRKDAYAKSLPGAEMDQGQLGIKLPENLGKRICFHGPGKEGDIFLTMPKERPHLITCFNVAIYYKKEEQKMFAELLAKAVREDGVLITTSKDSQKAFTERLGRLFGKMENLGSLPKSQGDLLVFSSPKIGLTRRLAQSMLNVLNFFRRNAQR